MISKFKNSKRGSSIVEASIIYPLVILIIAALISLSKDFLLHVKRDAQVHSEYAVSEIQYKSENLLRLKWFIK